MNNESQPNLKSGELTVESPPHIKGSMSKDRLMTYTFIALLILVGVSFFSWGITSLITSALAVLVAVGIDFLLYKVTSDSPLNTMSAAVFGLIVALSYSLGLPSMRSVEPLPLEAPQAYIFVTAISAVGMVLFKKLQGLLGRKYVNPAATAKLLVTIPFISTILIAADHLRNGPLQFPSLAGPIGFTVIGTNGNPAYQSFAQGLQSCFSNPTATTAPSVWEVLFLQRFHGWTGGASSLAVILVGVGLFIVCRKYIKWRITASYLLIVALMGLALAFAYGDGDPFLRVAFHLFVGSSIFMAFFMATDPATTPLTYTGQAIFGVGLGILTVLIQTYMNFFGGSILALVIMNLTVPLLDRAGVHKSFGR
jgi:electron transport complex protein RnfD